MFKKFLVLTLFFAPFAFSQVAPSTHGGSLSLSVGAEYSNFHSDYGSDRLHGIAAFADLDHIFLNKLGAEGEGRWLRFNQPQGETQDNYLLGPRYQLLRWNNFSFYGKFLFGGGWITYPGNPSPGSGSYFTYVPGATVEYRLTRRWKIRGDYEYQFWPSAPGTAFTYPNPSHGLTPNGFSVGASYRLF